MISKELKIHLLEIWQRGAITHAELQNIAKLANVSIGVNIVLKGEKEEAYPRIDKSKVYPLTREAKTTILSALYTQHVNSDTITDIARAIGVKIDITVVVEDNTTADKLRTVLGMDY